MALRAARQCLLVNARCCKLTLGCALAFRLGTIKSHVECGDSRSRYHGLNPELRPFSTYLPQNQPFSSLFSSNRHAMTLAPPQPPLEWNHSAEDITRLTKNAIEESRKILDSVGGLDAKDCTFESVSIYNSYSPYTKLRFTLGVCE
jgi:hypothetical protein